MMKADRFFVALPLECRELVDRVRDQIVEKSGLNVKVSYATVIATVLKAYVRDNA